MGEAGDPVVVTWKGGRSVRLLLFTYAVGSAVLLSGTGVSGGQPAKAAAADEDAVKQLVAEFDRCAREKDLEAFLSNSVEDVVALAPGEPAAVGKAALRSWYKGFYAAFDIAMVHRPIETHSFGDVVITRGDATGSIRSVSGGEPMQVDNKYLFVLKRQANGSLKVWRAMFNANGAATPADK